MNQNSKDNLTYDAIVVGTGISGGWAAKELSEKGLKTLVLERGRMIRHIQDYITANSEVWEFPHGDQMTQEQLKSYQVQKRTGYTIKPSTKHLWMKDTDHPYGEIKRFDWIRAYHVGGRSIMWGRQSYRLSEMDLRANERDGVGVAWPISYKEMEPWYDYVESFAGISGQADGISSLPDGKFLPPMEMTCLESQTGKRIEKHFPGRRMIIGRTANLTANHNGRSRCMYRAKCHLGCPFGAYFSSQSSTLPAAVATGNMTLRPNSIVTEVLFDPKTRKATGVRVQDAETGESRDYHSRIIFLNASTMNTAWILLNSTEHFPEGMGNSSGELGCNIMDHHHRMGAEGISEDFQDKYHFGRRPNGIYIPRFQNMGEGDPGFLRGYGFQGSGIRGDWRRSVAELSFGDALKGELSVPGRWQMGLVGFGEMLPNHSNRATMNRDRLDKHGLPTLDIDVEFGENEKSMRKDMVVTASEMLEAAELKNVRAIDLPTGPGLGIHEMGTARMGKSPKTSVLNRWNQLHDVNNVFVTDGSFMTSSACQNPSLTYMAMTARAADYAVGELKRRNL